MHRELVDDTTLEATGLCAHKIWRSAVFGSAIISQIPSSVEDFREAWTLVISAEVRVIDLLEDVGAEYGFRERSFDVFVPRLCCVASWVVRLRRLLSWN